MQAITAAPAREYGEAVMGCLRGEVKQVGHMISVACTGEAAGAIRSGHSESVGKGKRAVDETARTVASASHDTARYHRARRMTAA